jgi:hypothetical protein
LTTESADPAAEQPPQPKPRRRGRTALLMAAAVVLGVLGGGAVGYAAQSARKPTPLPPLAVPQPRYPAVRVAAPALPPSQDDMVRTDGDLTKLLLPTPGGASLPQGVSAFDSWLNIAQFSENYENPASEFAWLSDHAFRRAALSTWNKGSTYVVVQLVQFTHAYDYNALAMIQNESGYAKTWTGSSSVPLTGSSDGIVFPGVDQHGSGDATFYEGRAYGVHGDIAVELYLQDTSGKVSEQALRTILQEQLERL